MLENQMLKISHTKNKYMQVGTVWGVCRAQEERLPGSCISSEKNYRKCKKKKRKKNFEDDVKEMEEENSDVDVDEEDIEEPEKPKLGIDPKNKRGVSGATSVYNSDEYLQYLSSTYINSLLRNYLLL
jgi:hypothetical protein